MSHSELGLTMLGLIVIVIMMGFPTAFTLMGMGMFFGFIAFFDAGQPWTQNRIFDLMVQRTYGVMTNDTLLSIPLFVFMGYIIERATLVDKMFYSVQLAFRRVPASLAVTTLLICTFWGIASGIVGAVVVLMGVIALKPMLNAGYDIKFASGVITAGGTLGILIPPSVMLIVYAAVSGQSVVRLYAAAMFPGFFLAFLYLVYIIARALFTPQIAPRLPDHEFRVELPDWLHHLQREYGNNILMGLLRAALNPVKLFASSQTSYACILKNLVVALMPLIFVAGSWWGTYWFFIVHQASNDGMETATVQQLGTAPVPLTSTESVDAEPDELGTARQYGTASANEPDEPQALGGAANPVSGDAATANEATLDIPVFMRYFWASAGLALLLLAWFYRQMTPEHFLITKLLMESVVPLGILTVLVLAVILFGITTATESAAVGAAGALALALQAKQLTFSRVKESLFLTAKTTAMVCWLFVGSALFSAVFAILGGQQVISDWVLGMNLSPLLFMLLAQIIIFLLGWPLEWTEIIVIFVPIFLPLLVHFQIDPVLFGILVAINLQAAFLSPPVAMSAFYLKGVAPPYVTLNQIFAGMMPYMAIIVLCMVTMYIWPGMALWLPNYLYR